MHFVPLSSVTIISDTCHSLWGTGQVNEINFWMRTAESVLATDASLHAALIIERLMQKKDFHD